MNSVAQKKYSLWLKELRPQFCTASVMPILVGTAVAYSHTHKFNPTLFLLAVSSIALLQMASNVINDYFDSVSKNDWLNNNPTPFSGGSRLIQKNLLAPKEVFIGSLIIFAAGATLGIIIVIMTRSLFVLSLGVIGLLGGLFYTAPPLKLGYRTAGEITIAFLFGILPVYGAYYIQTGTIDFIPLLPAIIMAVMVFLIIFANEFPDFEADKAVSKKTLVVTLGTRKAAIFYRITTRLFYLLSIYSITQPPLLPIQGMIFILPTIILSAKCIKNADTEKLSQIGYADLSKSTILLHSIGGITLSAAILLS